MVKDLPTFCKLQIQAKNKNFGDTCGGTYKYLEVDYECLCKLTKTKTLSGFLINK